ncbi:hypothetical protein H311_01841 [Anncaliia algerae PRA109]|nr:hypothetical protein H311_01841 [Anncaliia algerae PRA109]
MFSEEKVFFLLGIIVIKVIYSYFYFFLKLIYHNIFYCYWIQILVVINFLNLTNIISDKKLYQKIS